MVRAFTPGVARRPRFARSILESYHSVVYSRTRRIPIAEREREAHGKPEHAARSWKLISVATDPTSQGVFMVWDTTGFFSG
jgi:hypothetical protein